MRAVMACARLCCDHEWIARVPQLRKLAVDEVMWGRPITGEEFERMLEAVPKVVGTGPSESCVLAPRAAQSAAAEIASNLWAADDKGGIRGQPPAAGE